MSGWGAPPGGSGQGDWGNQPPGGGQGGWGGPPGPPPPHGPSGPQNPYGGQPQQPGWGQQPPPGPPPGAGPQQPGWGQQPPQGPQAPQQPGWGQQPPPGPPQPGWGGPDPYGQQPAPYGQPDPYAFGGPQPPKKKTGLIIALAGGGGVVVIAIIVVAVLVFSNMGTDRKITTPNTAGGLQRDTQAESKNPSINQQKNKLKDTAGAKFKEVKSAIYTEGGADSSGTSGLGGNKVVFLGATASEKIDKDEFMKGFTKGASSGSTQLREVDAGDMGGKAACVSSSSGSRSIAVCVWVDDSTFGEVVPTGGKSVDETAELMLKMRNDIEQDA